MLHKAKGTGTIGSIGQLATSAKGAPYIHLSVCVEDKTETSAAKWVRVAVVGEEDITTVQQSVVKGALVEFTGKPYVETYFDKNARKWRGMQCYVMSTIRVKALPKAKPIDEVLPSVPSPADLEATVEQIETPELEGATPI